jgi:hypothetical protein
MTDNDKRKEAEEFFRCLAALDEAQACTSYGGQASTNYSKILMRSQAQTTSEK